MNYWSHDDARAVMRSGICKLGYGETFLAINMDLLHLCICCKNILCTVCTVQSDNLIS